jgi:hypothetical protein
LLVPFARCAASGCAEALRGLQLPHLQRLLSRLGLEGEDSGRADSLSPPHERALARAQGLATTDGLIPLAAWQLHQEGGTPGAAGWAWVTPCHWRVGRDSIAMAHPQELQLDADDSRALLAAMAPYFAGDGIALEYDAPLRWRARGDLFRALPAASLDRVIGRVVDPWLPRGDAGRLLRRLQQEMQMLLYTLPLTDARTGRGLLPVNSFWVSGSGALGTGGHAAPGLQVTHALADAALREDWAAWTAAWQELDARACARLWTEFEQGRTVRITLCGETASRTWSSTAASGWRRFTSLLARPTPATLLEGL